VESERLIVDVGEARHGSKISWEVTSPTPGKLIGIEKRSDANGPTLLGLRAPSLDQPMPMKWTQPRPLLDGKNLKGWEPIGNVENSRWVARDGELVNDNSETPGQKMRPAANIKTTEKFQNFKLHIEVNCHEGGNSGINSAAAMNCRLARRAASFRHMRWERSTADTHRRLVQKIASKS